MKFFKTLSKKENPIGASTFSAGTREIGGAKEGIALIKDGYEKNVIVYRAIREVAGAASSISFGLFDKAGNEIETHPILDLISRPNPASGGAAFFDEIFTNFCLFGEIAIAKSGLATSKEPRELWSVSPIEVKIEPGASGFPRAYVHAKNNVTTRFPVDQVSGYSDLFFMKTYNPLDYWRGMPPLRAAALAADAHNEGLLWNYSMMRNGARPSGVIKTPGASPSAEVIERLREWFKATMQGGNNAGEVGILTGGAEFISLSENAKDMDFILGMKEFSKYVSSAFGVPLPLIDNDAASFNNMEQAKERLWTDTVLPLVRRFLDSFNAWLKYFYGDGLTLKINEDAIPALEGLRNKRFERTVKAQEAGLITINEAREQIGFDKSKEENADKLFISGGSVPLSIADVGYDPTEAAPPVDDQAV